jgi:hypothetical protein
MGVQLTWEQRVTNRLSGKNDADLVARWNSIATIIEDELLSLNLERQYFDKALEVVKENPQFLNHPGHVFMEYVRSWYGNSMAAACRRQTDRIAESASLRVLLDEIKARPSAYRYDTLKPYMMGYQQSHVETMVMSEVSVVDFSGIDMAVVERDIAALETAGKTVKSFVDKHVAHTDIKRRSQPVQTSLNEVYAAAAAWEEIATRWITALKGVANLEVIDLLEWDGIFDVPWRVQKAQR